MPLNEPTRLELLRQYEVLDTAAEQVFDEITATAAEVCQTPVCLLTFIDRDRQWFKSRVGIDVQETPREIAICAYTICGTDLFVVPDTMADKRFADNPLVAGEPHIRFYAGMPLLSPEGLAVGTLCVLDSKPRTLTPDQSEKLKALAKGAVLLLEIRRARS